MENRFGFRDLVICTLLVLMIISVWLAMVQFDRQGVQIKEMKTAIGEQTGDLARVRRLLEQGVPVTSAAQTRPAADGVSEKDNWVGGDIDPFRRIKAAAKMAGYAPGDNYVSSFSVVPDNLTPLISGDAYSSSIQSYVLESLADRDPDTLEWSPMVARRWKVWDNSKAWNGYIEARKAVPLTEAEVLQESECPPAGKAAERARYVADRLKEGRRVQEVSHEAGCPPATVITFELRHGITFSDGQPLTNDDVVFTFDWTMNPDVQDPRQKAYYDKISKVEKIGDDQVAFSFREPYFQSFELAGTMSILPKHFYGRYDANAFNRSTGLLLGSGPYRLPDATSWKPEPGKPIELVRNERYWGGPPSPPFDRMIFRIIENEAARLTTFRNGDMDSIGPTPEQYISMLKDQALLKTTQHFEFDDPGAGYLFIGWNQLRGGKPTRFADKRVRQAMTLLADRERIVKEIEYGYGMVSGGPFSRLSKQSDPSTKPWPYDVERAKKLLAEAGYQDRDGDGILEGPDGQPFRFKLVFPASGETYKRVVLFLKDSYARAGVDLIPDPTDWNVLKSRLDDRQFDACSLGWTGGIEEDPYQIFDSSQIAGTGDNFVSYSNPELDRGMAQARAEVDENKRMPLWHQVHRLINEDQPYTFLYVRRSLLFISGRIKNVQRVKTGLNPRVEWFVPEAEWRWTKAR